MHAATLLLTAFAALAAAQETVTVTVEVCATSSVVVPVPVPVETTTTTEVTVVVPEPTIAPNVTVPVGNGTIPSEVPEVPEEGAASRLGTAPIAVVVGGMIAWLAL